jgi:hypothetical protein
MKYFTFTELTQSDRAKQAGIDNNPAPDSVVWANLEALVNNVLDPLRTMWGKPITVNSGYRSAALNKLIGGAKNSAHLTGEAADITAGSHDANNRLWELALEMELPFDQIIDEKNFSLLHISHKNNGMYREQILKM